MASMPDSQAEVCFHSLTWIPRLWTKLPVIIEPSPQHPAHSVLCVSGFWSSLFSASTAWGLGFSVREGTDSCLTSYTVPHVSCGVHLKKYSLSYMRPETAWIECGYGDRIDVVLAHSLGVLKGCCWITQRLQDSWPPEEKNSIRGQRRGLIAQSFCVIKFY